MGITTHNEIAKREPSLIDAFHQFARNGRWGTCGECPRDVNGNAITEACPNTNRHDHQLDINGLAKRYKIQANK